MIRSTLTGTALLATLIGTGGFAYHAGSASGSSAVTVSQPEDMDPMMAAMIQAGTPGEAHELLASAAGAWKAETAFMMGGDEPEVGKGSMYIKPILDGRYTYSTFKSDFMGAPFQGVALMGYDNVQEHYFSLWMDSMSTGVLHMTGNMEGDSLVLRGDAHMPQPMGTVEMKIVTTHPDPDTMHDVFYKKIEGEWVKDGEITYTRAGDDG